MESKLQPLLFAPSKWIIVGQFVHGAPKLNAATSVSGPSTCTCGKSPGQTIAHAQTRSRKLDMYLA